MDLRENYVEPLLQWFRKNKRDLPWRKNRNPYEIWISEIMLQQTRVEAVIGYYNRFLQQLPDVKSLADCEEDKLLKLWEGLGYYSRARNLKKGARLVMDEYGGQIPRTKEYLLRINGIGSYTAAAIASQAFEEPVAAVDGNVLRVYTRFFADDRDISVDKTKKEIEKHLDSIMPVGESGDFNQAMMELGAIVCVPNGAPKCEVCPLQKNCQAYKEQNQTNYPNKSPKKPRRIEDKTVLLINHGNKILIRKRKEKGLLAGLYEFPNLEGEQSVEVVLDAVKVLGLVPLHIQKAPEGKHIFSHVEWHMKGYDVRIDETAVYPEEYLFVDMQQLEKEYSVPSAFGIYKKYLLYRN